VLLVVGRWWGLAGALAKRGQILEQLKAVCVVGLLRLTQLRQRVAERCDVGSVQLLESVGGCLEIGQPIQNRGRRFIERLYGRGDDLALAPDRLEIILHQVQEPLLLAAVQPDDRRQVGCCSGEKS
jgi:hypothetical protein